MATRIALELTPEYATKLNSNRFLVDTKNIRGLVERVDGSVFVTFQSKFMTELGHVGVTNSFDEIAEAVFDGDYAELVADEAKLV